MSVDVVNSQEDEKSHIERPQFGNRILSNGENVFQHNAWDNVTWNEEQEEQARLKVTENSGIIASPEQMSKYEQEANRYWNSFYGVHQNSVHQLRKREREIKR